MGVVYPCKEILCLPGVELAVAFCALFCRKQGASPEDIEYYICQKEMMKDLCRSHQDVERIIGELSWSLIICFKFKKQDTIQCKDFNTMLKQDKIVRHGKAKHADKGKQRAD